jgi:hypothetical protein
MSDVFVGLLLIISHKICPVADNKQLINLEISVQQNPANAVVYSNMLIISR